MIWKHNYSTHTVRITFSLKYFKRKKDEINFEGNKWRLDKNRMDIFFSFDAKRNKLSPGYFFLFWKESSFQKKRIKERL